MVKRFQIFQTNTFICKQLNHSMYSYVIWIIQFKHTVKEFQVLLFNTNNSISHYTFVCTHLKEFQVLLCNANTSF